MALLSNALTSLYRFKLFAGITGTDDDTLLETLINTATSFVEGYIDRTLLLTANTNEIYDGNGWNRLLLKNYPVSDSATFKLEERDGDFNNNSWSEINSELYHVLYDEGIVDYLSRKFREAPRHYRITYTSGYDYDQATKTLESLGLGDLEYVVWKLVNNIYKKRKSLTGIQSESIGDYSVTYRSNVMADAELREILNGYIRPHIN